MNADPVTCRRLTSREVVLGRYMYGETLGRWRTADLLIGLAYLAQRESDEHPCADIAEHGRMLGLGLSSADRAALAVHSSSAPASHPV